MHGCRPVETETADRRRRRLHRWKLSLSRPIDDNAVSGLMPSRYASFDRSRLAVKPLNARRHDLHLANWLGLEDATPHFEHPDLSTVAQALAAARETGRARVLMMGAH